MNYRLIAYILGALGGLCFVAISVSLLVHLFKTRNEIPEFDTKLKNARADLNRTIAEIDRKQKERNGD